MPSGESRTLCPVCSAENSEHASVCASCGSFLQNRVPTLDLFRTAWGIVEHPGKTFGIIARAEHKNYAVFLYALAGIPGAMTCLHLFGIGQFFPSLLTMLPLGMILGAVLGSLTAPLAAAVAGLLTKVAGGEGSYRQALGGTAYAWVPLIAIAIVTLPIQWLTFGEYHFTLNPHPATINAPSYWVLQGLQAAGYLWSLVLLLSGIRIAGRTSWGKAVLAWAGTAIVVGGAWMLFFKAGSALLAQTGAYYTY